MTRMLSVAAATLADLSPADAVVAAAAAGFAAVGLWFDPDTWDASVATEVRRRLDDTGMVALDIEPVILSDDGDPGDRLCDAAAAVGAHHVLVASRRADDAWIAQRFAELCQRCAPAGVTVVLEFLPIFGVKSLAQAVAIVTAADQPNGGVLVDSLHLARSGATPKDLAGVPARLLPYLQVADAPAEAPDPSLGGLLDEALHGRSLPGQGGLPLAELVRAVPAVPLSAELRSRRLLADHSDPVARAAAVLASVRPLAGL